jgi:hypothetical protein
MRWAGRRCTGKAVVDRLDTSGQDWKDRVRIGADHKKPPTVTIEDGTVRRDLLVK